MIGVTAPGCMALGGSATRAVSTADNGASTSDSGSADSPADTGDTSQTTDSGEDVDTGDTAYIPAPCDVALPFTLDLYVHSSPDAGLTWDGPTWLKGNMSVPDLLSHPAIDGGDPWMLWMAFEDRVDQCDRLVYARVDPLTGSVGRVRPTTVLGTPPLTMLPAGYRHPVSDPDLVVVGDVPVLAHTLWPDDEPHPCIGISTGDSAGTLVGGAFTFQPQLRWCNEEGAEGYTDAMAAWVPDIPGDADSPGVLRIWTPSEVAMTTGDVRNHEWVVAVPDPHDAAGWVELERRDAPFSAFHLFGSAIRAGKAECEWQVWGTRDNWIRTACTTDFETWTEVGGSDPFAADPVVLAWSDRYLLYVTSTPEYTGEAP